MYPRTTSDILRRIGRSLAMALFAVGIPIGFMLSCFYVQDHHWAILPVTVFWIALAVYPLTDY
jgi:hypothetical protein